MKKYLLLAASIFVASCASTVMNSYPVDGEDFVSVPKGHSLEEITSRFHANLKRSIGIQPIYRTTATTKVYFKDYISKQRCESQYLCEIKFTYRGGERTNSMGKDYSTQVIDIILETSPDGKSVTVTYPTSVATTAKRNLIGMKLDLALSDNEAKRILNQIRQTPLH
ncbi:hypothetical protein [Bacterioplanoides pacificum]|uniref:Lipoprotein n=1 Tax=Bacterioplanoides pacificum TaxID=1171596 RepID=A0ABV7VSX7_9GAMM